MSGEVLDLIRSVAKLSDGKGLSDQRARFLFEAIETERRQRHLTVAALARRSGINPQTYRNTLCGISSPSARVLRLLAQALVGRHVNSDQDLRHRIESFAFGMLLQKSLQYVDEVPEALVRNAVRLKRESEALRLAIYLGNVELGLPQIRVAELAGVTKQYVARCAREVEERRDESGVLDSMLSSAVTSVQQVAA